MYKKLTTSAIFSLLIGASALPAAAENDKNNSVSSRINSLENELQLLKRKLEVNEEKQDTAKDKNATVELGKKGLAITSPDSKYRFETHGVFQFDNRTFLGDKNSTGRNDNIVRRARPILSFKAGDSLLYFMPDFAGTSSTSNNTKIFDAYFDHKIADSVKVRVGKFKTPVSLEQLQSDPETMFSERGYVAALTPSRDVGLQVYGDISKLNLEYQLGVFNGTTDSANTDGDSDDKKDLAARLFVKPFVNSSYVPLQGLGFGVGGSIGDREGSYTSATVSNRILPSYSTVGQASFFSYSSTTYASGTKTRLSPQAYWYSGNKGLLAEYIVTEEQVKNGTNIGTLEHNAYNVTVSYVLTGEDINFSGGVKPGRDFDLNDRSFGAFELIARITGIEFDKNTYPTFASSSTAAEAATSYGTGINWYLNENVKVSTNYNFTKFDKGAANGADRPDEQVIQSRLQFRF